VEIEGSAKALGSPLATMPSYPDLPMEEVYPRIANSDIPAAIAREYGKGRVVFFPWDIDRTFWEVMHPDHGRLIANAVKWALRDEPPLLVEGAGVFDAAVWEQRGSCTAHLVNLTNPMMMKGPYRETIPVGPLQVSLRLPAGRKARQVKLLVAETAALWRTDGPWVRVELPRIGLHEVVAVDL
jgi:LmbE family N-acetylglucosaminyl deacetylase